MILICAILKIAAKIQLLFDIHKIVDTIFTKTSNYAILQLVEKKTFIYPSSIIF